MARRVTSIDVAKRAGVSQSTVSRVFSTNSKVSEDKQKRVLEAAKELGYHPNAIARSLTTERTNIIGLVMANLTSPFYPYVLDKFLLRFQSMDKQTLLFTSAPNQEIDELLPHILQHRVDALIATSITMTSELAEECRRYGVPVILFNRYAPGTSAVCSDNEAGSRQVADILIDTGHQRIAYIAGTASASTNRDREKGFTDRLHERGVTDWIRGAGDFTYESGYAVASELLAREDRPDGIFCASDNMALGALDAARYEHGLNIPDDLSVIGFDDMPISSWPTYNLTTITQQVDLMIEEAISMLVERLEDPARPPETRLIPGILQIRGSVKNL